MAPTTEIVNMTPSQRYQQDLKEGVISFDANQEQTVELFDSLHARIQSGANNKSSVVAKLASLFESSGDEEVDIKGIYLWGGVGRGKTYLMDLFYDCLPGSAKRRTHFHRFMQSVQKELTELQGQKNPLETIARNIAAESKVICFDEFFVIDIGDAMILAGLMEALFRHRVILVATSNIEPDGLYENGLQRERFLPAIKLINEHCQVIELDGGVDYRLRRLSQATLYHSPIDENADVALLQSFQELVPNRSEIVIDGSIAILDREISTRFHAEDVVWFEFNAICDGPRSAFDYVEVAKLFHAMLVSNVPQFTDATNDQARRFVNLVDELYDRRVKLILSAAVEIPHLYEGELLSFEFERTKSRLLEMQSHDYLSSGHVA